MIRAFPTIVGSFLLALTAMAHETEQTCTVEGITARWAVSYCMTRFETDDDAHPEVSRCYVKELQEKLSGGPEENCDANLTYKSAICSILIEYKLYDESLAGCVEAEETIPSVVTNGIG